MSTRTPIPDAIIGSEGEESARLDDEGAAGVTRAPETLEDWRELARYNAQIADTLASEVGRLHKEIDRLKDGDAKAPMVSRADHGHPLWEEWVGLDLDDVWHLADAHASVLHGVCPKCKGKLAPGPYGEFQMCEDDNLCFIAGHGSFALDEIDRARDRGPD